MFVTADGIMAAYWPFWNLFQLPPTQARYIWKAATPIRDDFFFFFWSGFVFGRNVWSLAAAKPRWFSDCGGLQRLFACQWRVFCLWDFVFITMARRGSFVRLVHTCPVSVDVSRLRVYFVHRRWLAGPPKIFHFFFHFFFFLRREEKLWGWAEKSRSVFKLQVDEAGLEHLSFYPHHRFIKKSS